MAGLAYVASTGDVADLQRDPRFGEVPLRTLQRWASEERWAEQRDDVFQKARERARETITDRLAASMAREVDDLLALRDVAFQKLRDDAVEARSWEGVCKIIMEIHRRISELRAGEDVRPVPESRPIPETAKPLFSSEELAAKTALILKMRRDQMRAELARARVT